MDNKEIILWRIAEVLSGKWFFVKSNSEFKSRLKCVGLDNLFTDLYYKGYIIFLSQRMWNVQAKYYSVS